jgi:hypothetical protein
MPDSKVLLFMELGTPMPKMDVEWPVSVIERSRIIAWFLTFTERRLTRTIVYGLAVFVVIYGIDLAVRLFTNWNWYWERLACNALEAVVLSCIASRLSRLREESALRRQREMGYLNHHVRNSLAVIEVAAKQLSDIELRANTVRRASRRICRVLEQLSCRDDVSIDNKIPEKYERSDKMG